MENYIHVILFLGQILFNINMQERHLSGAFEFEASICSQW